MTDWQDSVQFPSRCMRDAGYYGILQYQKDTIGQDSLLLNDANARWGSENSLPLLGHRGATEQDGPEPASLP
jgi:hypothetical protein